jgi:hypothetical protein
MDYAKALTFLWEDPRWKEKLTIGTGVTLVSLMLMPIVIGIVGILIVMGYSVRTLQNVRDGNQFPLPEWDQWSEDLARGFKLAVVALVWGLPFILLWLPVGLGAILMGSGAENDANFFTVLGGLTFGFGNCLLVLYGIFYALVTPGFTVWFARNEQIGEGLKLTEIWEWTRRNLGGVVLVMIAYIVASIVISTVASIVGVVLCLVGLIVTVPLGTLATYLYQYHLIGQLAYKDRTGTPYYVPAAPVAPPPAPAAQPAAPPAEPPVEPDTTAGEGSSEQPLS